MYGHSTVCYGRALALHVVCILSFSDTVSLRILLTWPLQHPRVCIIQEYLVNGDLGTYLRSDSAGRSLTLEARLSMAVDTASGMEYLHSKSPPVIHRDLKSPSELQTVTSLTFFHHQVFLFHIIF